MAQTSFHPPLFVRKDLDGFFGLMIDNLIQLILIVSLCRELIHLPDSFIFGRILPGAAISILFGNFFYAWQARELAWKVGLVACFLNGVIEIIGAFVAERVRRVTPRAALLSALAGIAITFISMDFTF